MNFGTVDPKNSLKISSFGTVDPKDNLKITSFCNLRFSAQVQLISIILIIFVLFIISGQIMERCGVCSEKAYLSHCAHCEKKICEECKSAHMDILRREITRFNSQVSFLKF